MGCIQSTSDFQSYVSLPDIFQPSETRVDVKQPIFTLEREIRLKDKIREYGDLTLCVFPSGEFVVHSGCTPVTFFDLNGSSFWTIDGVQSVALKVDNLYCLCTDIVQILSSQAKLIRVIHLFQEVSSSLAFPQNHNDSELASPRIIVSQTSSDFIVQNHSKPSLPLKIHQIQQRRNPQENHGHSQEIANIFHIPEWSTFSHIFSYIHVFDNGLQSTFSFDPNIKSFQRLNDSHFIVLDWFNSVRLSSIEDLKTPESKPVLFRKLDTSSARITETIVTTTSTPFKNVTSIAVRTSCEFLPLTVSNLAVGSAMQHQFNTQLYMLCADRLFIYSVN